MNSSYGDDSRELPLHSVNRLAVDRWARMSRDNSTGNKPKRSTLDVLLRFEGLERWERRELK